MPRISALPQDTTTLDGAELTTIVKDDITQKRPLNQVRYSPLSHGSTSTWYVQLISSSVLNITTIAEIELYQRGVKIPVTDIVSIAFAADREAPINTTGDITDLIDDDPATFFSFEIDGGGAFNTTFEITLTSSLYRVDEIRVTFAPIGSGIPVDQAPSFAVVESYGPGVNGPYYTFSTYTWDTPAWTLGEIKALVSDNLFQSLNPITTQFSSFLPDSILGTNNIFTGNHLRNITFVAPWMVMGNSNKGLLPLNLDGDQLAYDDINVELMPQKSRIVNIFASETMDNTWLGTNENYMATKIVFDTGAVAPATLTVISSASVTNPKHKPVGVQKTIINANATHSLTVDLTGFTVIGSASLVIAAEGILNILEIADGVIAVW
jgi:hypothetical protein